MTTAVVLSGGGNLGATQVGMLRALVEHGVRPDVIVGTSVGAVNGAWMASRFHQDGVNDLADLWRSLRRREVYPFKPVLGFRGFVGKRDHLVSPAGLRFILETHLQFDRLEDAPIPLRVVAADARTGEEVLLARGDAVDAVLASAAIPGLFPPVRIESRHLIDGGVVDNTPIRHAVAFGADEVWVASVGFARGVNHPPRSAIGMMVHGIAMSAADQLRRDVAQYQDQVRLHVLPTPEATDISPIDFRRTAELIERGYASTRGWLAERLPR